MASTVARVSPVSNRLSVGDTPPLNPCLVVGVGLRALRLDENGEEVLTFVTCWTACAFRPFTGHRVHDPFGRVRVVRCRRPARCRSLDAPPVRQPTVSSVGVFTTATRCSPGSVLKPPRFPPELSVATGNKMSCLGLVVVCAAGSDSCAGERRDGVCVCGTQAAPCSSACCRIDGSRRPLRCALRKIPWHARRDRK